MKRTLLALALLSACSSTASSERSRGIVDAADGDDLRDAGSDVDASTSDGMFWSVCDLQTGQLYPNASDARNPCHPLLAYLDTLQLWAPGTQTSLVSCEFTGSVYRAGARCTFPCVNDAAKAACGEVGGVCALTDFDGNAGASLKCLPETEAAKACAACPECTGLTETVECCTTSYVCGCKTTSSTVCYAR